MTFNSLLQTGIVLMISTVFAQEAANLKPILRESFDQEGSGFRKRALRSPRIELAKGEGKEGSDAIRVAYEGYERGSKRVVFRYPLKKKVTRATLAFDVKFENDFQWTQGGKLHGLGPAKPITGGNTRVPHGWSARMMFKEEGKISTYLYDQDLTKKWGVGDKTPSSVFKTGQWHQVVMQVTLNDPGLANGSATVFVDGENVVQTEKVTFRGKGGENTMIQAFLFSTFHGGNQPKWTPVDAEGNPTTVHALYDNFMVLEGIHLPSGMQEAATP